MTKLTDWKRCNELYCEWMYWEAAERGYDARAAAAAERPYVEAFMAYKEKYGEMFNPERKPEETSILDDASELGLRVEYHKFLTAPGTPRMEFEAWKASRETV